MHANLNTNPCKNVHKQTYTNTHKRRKKITQMHINNYIRSRYIGNGIGNGNVQTIDSLVRSLNS